jgi:DNA-binding transcriptional LysR family regulator
MIVIGPPGETFKDAHLGEATWLVREAGSGTRIVTEQCFAALGIDPPRLSIGSNGAIGAGVRAGLGFSLVSRDAVAHDLRSGALVAIETAFTPLDRQWHLVAASDRDLTPAVARFAAFAIAECGFVGAAFRESPGNQALLSDTPDVKPGVIRA